jgi:hypothetical protein
MPVKGSILYTPGMPDMTMYDYEWFPQEVSQVTSCFYTLTERCAGCTAACATDAALLSWIRADGHNDPCINPGI